MTATSRRTRGINRTPKLPAELQEFYRQTSKQVWAEIAYDLCVQMLGGDDPAVTTEAVRGELKRRHKTLAGQGLSV